MIDDALIEELKATLSRGTDVEYFLDNLTTPDWAVPLFEAGLFGEPPDLIREEGMVSVPAWAPARYLARVAVDDPDAIASVVQRISATDNTRVHRDLILALVPASPERILPMVPTIKEWLSDPLGPSLLLDPVIKIIESLAQKGAFAEALEFFLHWLSPTGFDSDAESPMSVDQWEFEHALDGVVPVLVSIDASQTLKALVELLSRVLSDEFAGLEGAPPYDGSTAWRTAVEEDQQNGHSSNRARLLVRIRDVAREAAGEDCAQVADTVAILRSGRWFALIRVAINLVREAGEVCPELVASFLGNRELFDEPQVFHEYMTLLRDRFGVMPADQQNQVLAWISAGPDTAGYYSARSGQDDHPPSEDEVAGYVAHWKVRRLKVLERWLSGEQLANYRQLVARTGEVEHPEYLTWSSGIMTGPTSPFTREQILSMPLDDLIGQLREWEPPDGFMLPTPEGLSRELASAIVSDPSRFLGQALMFRDMEPSYVRAVFDGVRQLLGRAGDHRPTEAEWTAVLELAEWVVRQGPSIEGENNFDRDVGWTETRKVIAHLLDGAMSLRILPLASAGRVWSVIELLLEDPQPSPDFEARYGRDNMDPATLAINTVRGTAMHAALQYVLWGTAGEGPYPVEPSVLESISWHLDPSFDPSGAVRSVFGWWYPEIALHYPEWAHDRTDQVFPLEDPQRALFDAAWPVYLARWRPSRVELVALRAQYALGVALLGRPSGNAHVAGSLSSADQLLGQHLVWLYATGELSFDDDLLTLFRDRATPEVAASSMQYLGRLLDPAPPPPEVWDRVRAWWESRKVACTGDPSRVGELGAFGWWSGAAQFDPGWYLAELEGLLRQGVELDGEFSVIKQLSIVAGAWPGQSVECLRLMEASGHYGWLILGHQTEVETLLRGVLASGDPEASQAARRFIDYLAAKGTADLSRLLDE